MEGKSVTKMCQAVNYYRYYAIFSGFVMSIIFDPFLRFVTC